MLDFDYSVFAETIFSEQKGWKGEVAAYSDAAF